MSTNLSLAVACALWAVLAPSTTTAAPLPAPPPHEQPPAVTQRSPAPAQRAPARPVTQGKFVSVQVNLDEFGQDVLGDAANEPSLAVNPNDASEIVVGWRQFNTIESDHREAGIAYSGDSGATWTALGTLATGRFGSDPVLVADASGVFYYLSIDFTEMRLFRSFDGGACWDPYIQVAPGFRDKPWLAVDTSNGPGAYNLYLGWYGSFERSFDGGVTWSDTYSTTATWGTLCVGADGAVYAVDRDFNVSRSTTAHDPASSPDFETIATPGMGGSYNSYTTPNPGGLVAQPWIAADLGTSGYHGNLYVLCTVDPPGPDPLDVKFIRSEDGGFIWSSPVRVNDDAGTTHQWFGAMGVAPNGRIDAAWYDTRDSGIAQESALYYSFSIDAGQTWAPNVILSPTFNTSIGYPDNQTKIGDYIGVVSTASAAHIVYSATFNGGQDVWFVRVPADCNLNGVPDDEDIADGTSEDCSGNDTPDECEPDCNANGAADSCDLIGGRSEDCDGNGRPDECQPDFDGDGQIDLCDDDIDNDGVANEDDACTYTPLGTPVGPDGGPAFNSNDDCVVDLVDHDRFLICRSTDGPGSPPPFDACVEWADADGDGDVDMTEFALLQNGFTGP